VVSLNELDEARLLTYVLKGDHKAFSVLVQRHSQVAYAVAYRFVGDRYEAEDIVQTAFLKLWERPGMWNPELDSRFTTWFYRVVVNLCLDWRKKKKPLLNSEPCVMRVTEINQEDQLLKAERQTLLEVQIRALPRRQRIAINLSYLSGLSNKEAAAVMGVSLRALQSLILRAKSNIRKKLESYYESLH
jgi:RNA polymerase sigma-70 factor (ECF subfamily)